MLYIPLSIIRGFCLDMLDLYFEHRITTTYTTESILHSDLILSLTFVYICK